MVEAAQIQAREPTSEWLCARDHERSIESASATVAYGGAPLDACFFADLDSVTGPMLYTRMMSIRCLPHGWPRSSGVPWLFTTLMKSVPVEKATAVFAGWYPGSKRR